MPLSGRFPVSLVTRIILALIPLPHVEGLVHIPLPTSRQQLVGDDHLTVVPYLAVLIHQHHPRTLGFHSRRAMWFFTIRNDCNHEDMT